MSEAYGPIRLRLAQTGDRSRWRGALERRRLRRAATRCSICVRTPTRGELEEMLDVFSTMPAASVTSCAIMAPPIPPFDGRPIQFVDVLPRTADGKVDLFPDSNERRQRSLQLSA